jgi:hypothetical protein
MAALGHEAAEPSGSHLRRNLRLTAALQGHDLQSQRGREGPTEETACVSPGPVALTLLTAGVVRTSPMRRR